MDLLEIMAVICLVIAGVIIYRRKSESIGNGER